jgi:hypothetical protein
MSTTTVTPQLYSDLDKKLPIVMLPVRIETRYFAAGGTDVELRVRIFPSSVHVTTDRPMPDPVERDETVVYWTTRKSQGDAAAATDVAWQRLTGMFGDARAQWLRRILTPTVNANGTLTFPNITVTPPSGDGSFLASEATGLPTRFIVSGFAGAARQFAIAGQKVPASVAVGPHGDDKAIAWQTDFTAAEAIGLGIRIHMTRAAAGQLTRIYVYGVREGVDAATSAAAIENLLERHVRADGATLMKAGTSTNNTTVAPTEPPPLAPETTPPAGTDGFRIARSLGVDAQVFGAIGGSNVVSDLLVVAMHTALWPATVEYFMKQAMSPMFSDTAATRLQASYRSYVRPRGPYPALLIGSQPYGILPATSAANWRTAVGTVDPFMRGLHTLSADWFKATGNVPRLGAGADTGSDMIAILSQSPVSRRWVGRTVESHMIAGRIFEGADPAKYEIAINNIKAQKLREELTPLGLSGTPLAMDFIFNSSTFDIRAPLVASSDADRKAPLQANYITAINTAKVDDLKNETITGASPRTLLYMFLRHSTLLLIGNTATAILAKPPLREAVFVESTTDTVWTRLKTPVVALGNKSLSDALGTPLPNNIVALANLNLHRQALNALAAAPVGELERLTAEAIDAASHRLDAWITAQATERLNSMRNASPLGAHLGAYGWIDAPAVPASPPADGAAPFADPDSEGFIHAPRLEHARTGAILRSAFLNRATSGAQAQYAVDLSSDRVRMAKQIIAEIQGGANLSALLSARIERLMADMGLGPQLPGLRQQFPLDSGDGRKRIDGLALAQAWRKTPPAANLLPVSNLLMSTIDAVGDLLLAEAIHQQSSGSPNRARTALSGLETGTTLPDDFDVVRTQSDAVTTTWRLILPVADSALDAWIGGLVGNPAQLNAFIKKAGGATQTMSVASLGITARGLLDFVQDGPDAPALAKRFRDAASATSATFTPALQNALVAAYAISLLLRNSRALAPADLGDKERTPLADFDAASKRRQWLHDVGRLRQPVQALAMLDAVLTARGTDLQLKFASAGPHLTLITLGDWPDASATGLLLDGWNETTPGLQAATGVAVHYNAPRSRPPQAILLLVPPNLTAGWDVFGVETILSETADLARMRMVRPCDVHGSFLPALYFADNLAADTVATDFIRSAFVVEVKQ